MMGVRFIIKVQAITDHCWGWMLLNCRGADYRRDVCYNWGLGMLVIVGLQVVIGGAGYCKI
jgi:hypothetical protein